QPFSDLAGDPEADRVLDARSPDPGIGQCPAAPTFATHHNLYRPHDFLLDFGLTGATAECRNQRDWQEQPQPTRACAGEERERFLVLRMHDLDSPFAAIFETDRSLKAQKKN